MEALFLHLALLQWQISTRLFSKGQVDVITDCLMKCFCYKDMDVSSLQCEVNTTCIYIWVQSKPSLDFSAVFLVRDECSLSRVSSSYHHGLLFHTF